MRRPASHSRIAAPRARARDAWIFAAISGFALALRLAYLAQWRRSPTFDFPILDERYHDEWAQAIAAGRAFVEGAYFRAPLYPWFLGLVYRLCGHDYLAPRIAQAVLGSLGCGLVYLIGRDLFGRAVGAAAACVAAADWILLYFGAQLLIEPLLSFLLVVFVWLLLRCARSRSWLPWGLAGLLLGVSALARPNMLVIAPAVVAWALWGRRPGRASRVRATAAFAVGCALAVAPVTARNRAFGHEFVLIASQGGLNFWIGNNAHSDGRTANPPEGPQDFTGAAFASREAGRTLKPGEISSFYYHRAWDFIRREPRAALELTLLKARLWWSRYEIGNDENIYFWAHRFAPMTRWLAIGFPLIGPLGLVGLGLALREARRLFPLWGTVLVYSASFLPFFANARFRMPVVAPLILLGAFTAGECVRVVRRRRWRAAAAMGAALLAAALWVNATPHVEPGDRDFVSLVTLGNVYFDRGEYARALEAHREALAVAPTDLQAGAGLAETLIAMRRLPEGIEALRRVAAGPRAPRAGDSDALLASVESALATGLAETRDYAGATEHFRAAIRLNPAGARGGDQYNLGLVLGAMGQPAEARAAFEGALAVNPDFEPARAALARLDATATFNARGETPPHRSPAR